MRERKGHYDDAIRNKLSVVIALISECFGGVAPAAFARLSANADAIRDKGAIDRTKYGKLRASSKTYLTHHLRRLSWAIVKADADQILYMIRKEKQRRVQRA